MSYGQRKKSTGTGGPSQAGLAKDVNQDQSLGRKKFETWLNLSAKHLQKGGSGDGYCVCFAKHRVNS